MTSIHRTMQRHGLGIEIPIKDRTCEHCEQVFASVQGMKTHQTRGINESCKRSGKHKSTAEAKRLKISHVNECKSKQIPENHDSVFS